jgi:uncharacterized RDD family membrane protein YckC
MNSKTAVLTFRTPEGIEFSLTLAGPVSRFLAWVVDFLVIVTLSYILGNLLQILAIISVDFTQAMIGIFNFVIPIAYGIVTEWRWRGQTVGKRLFRLRVMDEGGLRLQFSQIVMRNLFRLVDCLPLCYLVGGIACLVSRRAQRLGDFAASTIVVRVQENTQPDLNQILAGKFNSFRAYPHLQARLRQRIKPAEAALALQALVRRDSFDPQARVKLFGELADHFRSVIEFPQEATDGLSDEQYVRNVLDSLYSIRKEISSSVLAQK